jgi:hypothetical protein
VRQYAENEHRTGLIQADKVGVVEQLSLLKASAAQIAKRTRMRRSQVDQALAVTRSDLARAATVRYELTPDQAAAIAEFRHQPRQTVKPWSPPPRVGNSTTCFVRDPPGVAAEPAPQGRDHPCERRWPHHSGSTVEQDDAPASSTGRRRLKVPVTHRRRLAVYRRGYRGTASRVAGICKRSWPARGQPAGTSGGIGWRRGGSSCG